MKFLKLLILLLFAGSLTGQVKLSALERTTTKFKIPVANYKLPNKSDYAMSYMSLQAALDSAGIGTIGEDGLSAYEIAVVNGFEGDVGEWLLSLNGEQGEPGMTGQIGLSAFEIAQNNGFVGSQEDWLNSLVGSNGVDGADGLGFNWRFDWSSSYGTYMVGDVVHHNGKAYICHTEYDSSTPNTEPGNSAGWQFFWDIMAEKGTDGTNGTNGAAGTQFRTASGVPSNGLGIDGDMYLNIATWDLYKKVAGVYTLDGSIKGATGLTGNTGATGAAGATIRSGVGVPSNGLGANGDYYLNTSNSDFYYKSGGTYSVVDNFTGLTGATGSTGATGATGPAGSNGTNGTNGTNGVDGADGLGVPAGGTAGQVLAKIDGTDNNTEWIDPPTGGGGASVRDYTDFEVPILDEAEYPIWKYLPEGNGLIETAGITATFAGTASAVAPDYSSAYNTIVQRRVTVTGTNQNASFRTSNLQSIWTGTHPISGKGGWFVKFSFTIQCSGSKTLHIGLSNSASDLGNVLPLTTMVNYIGVASNGLDGDIYFICVGASNANKVTALVGNTYNTDGSPQAYELVVYYPNDPTAEGFDLGYHLTKITGNTVSVATKGTITAGTTHFPQGKIYVNSRINSGASGTQYLGISSLFAQRLWKF